MSSANRQDRRKKLKYRSDGSGIWQRPILDGPGVWITCPKGKERQTIGEMYDLFESIADDLWPSETDEVKGGSDDEGLSLEDQISREVQAIKRPRKEQRFASCQTNTPCVIFISCKKPVDPVKLVMTHVHQVRSTGTTRTSHALRLVPIASSCTTSLPDIQLMCKKVFAEYFENTEDKTYTYKIELSIRNHSTLTRSTLLQGIAECVPAPHKVDLSSPEVFVLVEVFKSVCGISVVKDYYKLQKFNLQELASSAKDIKAVEGVRV